MAKKTIEQNSNHAIEVYLHEHGKLRDEIMHHVNTKLQIPVWSFGAASIAIPILLSQSENISKYVLAILFYSITIIFSAMAMNYAATLHGIHRITDYIREKIEPNVNKIINKGKPSGFQYENYIKEKRRSILYLYLEVVGEIGTILLLVFPGFASLISATYALSLEQNLDNPVANFQINASVLNTLHAVSIGIYALSIFSILAVTIYAIRTALVRSK